MKKQAKVAKDKVMEDFEDVGELPWDEEQSAVIAGKLKTMFNNIKKVIDEDLMRFTVDELEILEAVYGSRLVYPIYPDIEKMLSLPETSELIH